MTVLRMDHVCVVVDDLEAAKAFFNALGLELVGDGTVEGETVDRVVGLEGVRSDIAMMRTPDGNSQIELVKYLSPPPEGGAGPVPPNTFGINHLTFAVDDVDAVLADLQPHGAGLVGEVAQYGDSYKLCYIRGPEGIIVELAEKLGGD